MEASCSSSAVIVSACHVVAAQCLDRVKTVATPKIAMDCLGRLNLNCTIVTYRGGRADLNFERRIAEERTPWERFGSRPVLSEISIGPLEVFHIGTLFSHMTTALGPYSQRV